MDGVPLCGEEGEKAREEQRKFIERMISQQVKIFFQILWKSRCNILDSFPSHLKTCPKGFGLKLAKLGLKTPLKNKVKQKPS